MISVITAAYNCESYIAQAIQSVQTQTYRDWEMIVVDDCSDDKTVQIVQALAATDARIKLIVSGTKLLAAGARNLATQHAQGHYIAILDGDDLWAPTKLERQMQFMQANQYAFTATAYRKIDANDRVGVSVISVRYEIDYKAMLYTNHIGCLTVMYDVSKVGKLYFDASYQYQEDYILWLDTLKHRCAYAYGLNEPLAFYRVHSQAKSANKFKIALYRNQVYKRYFGWGLAKRCYYYVFYVLNGLWKYWKG